VKSNLKEKGDKRSRMAKNSMMCGDLEGGREHGFCDKGGGRVVTVRGGCGG